MTHNHLNQSTYRAGLLQSRAYRALMTFLNSRLEPYNLTSSEWAVIGCLTESKRLRPTAIAEQLGVKSPVATRLIRSLLNKGLLEITADKRDRRAVNVTLTKLGAQRSREIEAHLRTDMRAWLRDVDLKELNSYLGVMEQIAGLL